CADYMCACILHRYFTQVRSMALRTMNYSLTTPNKEMYYPLEELAQVLAFEDADEASDFCTFFGLDVAESSVIFMRGSFVEPVNKYPMRRTQRLIESKRNYSIGQVTEFSISHVWNYFQLTEVSRFAVEARGKVVSAYRDLNAATRGTSVSREFEISK
ncbi:predicted protein, partial [Nematostella vectensis]